MGLESQGCPLRERENAPAGFLTEGTWGLLSCLLWGVCCKGLLTNLW